MAAVYRLTMMSTERLSSQYGHVTPSAIGCNLSADPTSSRRLAGSKKSWLEQDHVRERSNLFEFESGARHR